MSTPNPQVIARYIAIDAHKQYVVGGGLNAQMEMVLPLHRHLSFLRVGAEVPQAHRCRRHRGYGQHPDAVRRRRTPGR
jgi:hypothetical protein